MKNFVLAVAVAMAIPSLAYAAEPVKKPCCCESTKEKKGCCDEEKMKMGDKVPDAHTGHDMSKSN